MLAPSVDEAKGKADLATAVLYYEEAIKSAPKNEAANIQELLDAAQKELIVNENMEGFEIAGDGLTGEEIYTEVSKIQNDLIACYFQEYKKNKGLAVKVFTHFIITPEGVVAYATVIHSTLSHP